MDESKRSGQIPAFGNWDFTNDLPITRYFECARQAGLSRYSSSSTETATAQLHLNKPLPLLNYNKQETRNRERRCRHVNANKVKARKVYDVREQGRKPMQQHDTVPRPPKPIDEDLYQIPPELIHSTNKRKKMLGFISKCLVPAACVS